MEVKLKCEKLNFDGTGVVFHNGKDFSVTNMLPFEEGIFEVISPRKISLVKIENSSLIRIKPVCPVFDSCGGCQYLNIDYLEEIKLKNLYLADLFSYLKMTIKPINAMFDPYYYRNKCQMVYKLSKTKKVVCGFYEENSHKIVTVSDCALHAKPATKIINAVNLALSNNKIKPYDELTGEGTIRHILIRYGFFTKQIMLVIVTNGEMFPGRNNVMKDLLKMDLNITTIVQNYNARDTSIVLGDKERILMGPGFIYDQIDDLRFKISSKSFYQVNTIGMKRLYQKAIEMANIKSSDIVMDTYSGIGTISIFAAKKAQNVYGIELNPEAVKDAQMNAKINGIKNVEFINDDATRFMQQHAKIRTHIDILILDPPRNGSTKEFIKAVGSLKPKKVIYISCDPETLKRDLTDFFAEGYKISDMEFFDMFPRTFHVECVVLMSRVEK